MLHFSEKINMEPQIKISEVTPLRYVQNQNLIICRRNDVYNQLKSIALKINHDVANSPNLRTVELGIMYAVQRENEKNMWHRAFLKFRRQCDCVDVLHLVDIGIVLDLTSKIMVRKIESQEIRNLDWGQFKMAIYAVIQYQTDHEFHVIFDSVKGKKMKAVYGLIGKRPTRFTNVSLHRRIPRQDEVFPRNTHRSTNNHPITLNPYIQPIDLRIPNSSMWISHFRSPFGPAP